MDEDRRIRRSDLLHEAQDLSDDRALPGDLALRADDSDLGLEVLAFCLEAVLQSLDLRVGLPERLLAALPLGDIAEDTEGLDRASRAVTGSDGGQVVDPHLPSDRIQEPILRTELVHPPIVQLVTLVHDARAIVRMQVLHPELHGSEAAFLAWWQTAEDSKPVVDVGDALVEIHLVERQAGEVGSGSQTRLAVPRAQFVTFPLGYIRGDLRRRVELAVPHAGPFIFR